MNIKPRIKTERLELRLSPQQKLILAQLAAEEQLTISEYIIQYLKLPQ